MMPLVRLGLAFAALAALTVYGFVTRHLFSQPIWTPSGQHALLILAACTLGWSALWTVLKPSWLLPASTALALTLTTAIAGWQPVAACLLMLASSYSLGRLLRIAHPILSTLAGLSLWMWLTSHLAHWPINKPWLYLLLLALPLITLRPKLPPILATRAEAAALAVALVPIAAHLVVSLGYEVSSDGLAMHLAVPMWIANHAQWTFDPGHASWAVMPMGAEWLSTIAYLLGGESASRLLNFCFFLLTVALIHSAVRRFSTPVIAYVAVALYASTPIVQLITGSLFVENLWIAYILGALTALWHYRDTGNHRLLLVTGLLLGAALHVKIAAMIFVALVGALALFEARKSPRLAALTVAVAALIAAPAYVTAYLKSGNPTLPLLNGIFRSPYFAVDQAWHDPRYAEPIRWTALFDMTFDSHRYLEGQDASLGFHYLLLLPLALLLLRTLPYPAATAAVIAIIGGAFNFALQPNLRYLSAALPLATIAAAFVLSRTRWLTIAAVLCAAVNCWFLASSGWYHKDLLPHFTLDAPRRLVAYSNQHFPNQPVLFLETDQVAGLNAKFWTDGWRTWTFAHRLERAHTLADVHALLRDYNIRLAILPTRASGVPVREPAAWRYIERFGSNARTESGYYLAQLTDPQPADLIETPTVAAPGAYDDFDPAITFEGEWTRDTQFTEAFARTLTYTDAPNARGRFQFTGTSVTWFYTKATNRGLAEVRIDGVLRATIDLYSPNPAWRSASNFSDLPAGPHQLEILVTGRHSAAATGSFVDVDRIESR